MDGLHKCANCGIPATKIMAYTADNGITVYLTWCDGPCSEQYTRRPKENMTIPLPPSVVDNDQVVYFLYTNWEGKTQWRRAVPLPIPPQFKVTQYHPLPGWIITMYDLDRNERREFSLKDIQKMGTEQDYFEYRTVNAH